jgi:hypothetical protein
MGDNPPLRAPAERAGTARASVSPESESPDRVDVELERSYASEREAEEFRRALEADRPEYLETERVGRTLRFRVSAKGAASARSTLDDLLAALAAAERTRGIGSRGTPATTVP